MASASNAPQVDSGHSAGVMGRCTSACVGPIVAAMMIPVFKWLFGDWQSRDEGVLCGG